jgi:hypothetical protein
VAPCWARIDTLEGEELIGLVLPLPDIPLTYIWAVRADRGTRTGRENRSLADDLEPDHQGSGGAGMLGVAYAPTLCAQGPHLALDEPVRQHGR